MIFYVLYFVFVILVWLRVYIFTPFLPSQPFSAPLMPFTPSYLHPPLSSFSKRYGCLGRPSELGDVPASYTPVPGLVEGLHDFGRLGPVCSVACGRYYTAVALEPYTGPSLAELESKTRAKEIKKTALKRAREEKRIQEEREEKLRAAKARKGLCDFLNAGYPGCRGCKTAWDCAGFVPDIFRPTSCIICGHERDQHSLIRQFNDDKLTNEMLQDFVETVEFHMKRTSPDSDSFVDNDPSALPSSFRSNASN